MTWHIYRYPPFGYLDMRKHIIVKSTHYKEFANIQLIYNPFLVVITTCDLLQCLVTLDKSHKILIVINNTWHQIAKTIA